MNHLMTINQIDLLEKLNYQNSNNILKLKKISTKISIKNNNIAELMFVSELVTGTKPILVKSKKHLAAFRLKKDKYVAACATLRSNRLSDFLLNYLYFYYKNNFVKLMHNQVNRNVVNFSIVSIKSSPIVNEEVMLKVNNTYGSDISFVFNKQTTKSEIILFLSAINIYIN